jgi:ATP-dependent helicase/DNAse subunit B
MLETLVSWECAENGDRAVFSPYRLEVGFGVGSSPSPLQVQTEEGDFLIRGVIDRLDRDTHGNLRVIDYKSGRTQYWSSDMKAGTATQTALYALAAQEYWLRAGARVVESYYLHIPIREKSGRLRFSGRVEEDHPGRLQCPRGP